VAEERRSAVQQLKDAFGEDGSFTGPVSASGRIEVPVVGGKSEEQMAEERFCSSSPTVDELSDIAKGLDAAFPTQPITGTFEDAAKKVQDHYEARGLNGGSPPERTVVETLPAEVEAPTTGPAAVPACYPDPPDLEACRRLDSHKVPGNELNEVIEVYVLDDPGPGGANHEYLVRSEESPTCHLQCLVQFQDGPIGEVGVTGLSNEALLAVVEDRLRGFQSGPFACEDNKAAWAGVRSALTALKRRTVERMARGVEGKSEA